MNHYIYFILISLFWGGSFVAIKHTVHHLPSDLAAFYRVLIAFVFVIIMRVFVPSSRAPMPMNKKKTCWFIGLISIALPFSLLFWAETKVSAGLASIFNGTVPIHTIWLTFFIFKTADTITKNKLIGLGLGLVGTIVMSLPSVELGQSTTLGIIALSVMAISYALSGILAKLVITKEISILSAVFQYHLSGLILLALYVTFNGSWSLPDYPWTVWGGLAYMGILSNAIAFLLYFKLINLWGPIKSSMVTYIVPCVTMILDYIIYDNILQRLEFFGLMIVFLGILISQNNRK